MRYAIVMTLAILWAATAIAEEPDDPEHTVEPPMIRVSSTPPGAAVRIDGYDVGPTPALVVVSPGRHEVVVELGNRRTQAVVQAREDEVDEVVLEGRLPPSPFDPRDERPAVRQARDMERPVPAHVEPPPEPWVRRIPETPFAEIALRTGILSRSFDMEIDSAIDVWSRPRAEVDSGAFGVIGFDLSFFPFARVPRRRFRGLGLNVGAALGVGLDIVNNRTGESIDAGYYEVDVLATYTLVLGRPDRGARLGFDVGWHRTSFRMGRDGNDIVPPMTYDCVRIGVGLEAPIATRYVSFRLAGWILAVGSVGSDAPRAYGEGDPSSFGGEVEGGLVVHLGKLELAATWRGRWLSTEYSGRGEGWGEIGNPDTTYEYLGIRPLDRGLDAYQSLRLTLGARF